MPGCRWRVKATGLRQLPSSPSVAAGLQPQTSRLPSRVGPCVEQDPLSRPSTPRLPSESCMVDVPHPGLPVNVFLPAQLPVSPVHPEPPEADSWAAPKSSCPTASPPGQLSLHVPRLGRAKAHGLQHSGGFTCSSHCLLGPYNVNTRAVPSRQRKLAADFLLLRGSSHIACGSCRLRTPLRREHSRAHLRPRSKSGPAHTQGRLQKLRALYKMKTQEPCSHSWRILRW